MAVREERLQDVHAEREGHDRLRARPHDHTLDPQPNEGHERAERLHDVRVIGTGLFDHRAQLGVAVRADLCVCQREREGKKRGFSTLEKHLTRRGYNKSLI